ncbi:28S ribosomal protein S26, mitochondrial-like [Lytechinus variegatus]|uniref:28S ribosomal protein S26, mitochondrial-like n=1 Tax=Lytechinus variegatus TaxID=7654 RepID=UPI001BB2C4B5|nr:28S ribosomal protein S26, mitochondrial-like [Lytechinus variegatus]
MYSILRTYSPYLRALQRSWEPINATGSLQIQQIRWRKRRTDPKAKSKIGRVREPTPFDPWERDFLVEKMPHYRSTMNAVRHLFNEELERKKDETAEGLSSVEQEREEEEAFRQLLKWNEQENAKINARRKEKLAAKAKEIEEENLQRLLRKEEQEAEEIERMRQLVLQEQEASKTFITMETMEAAINEALDNPKNYDFLIKKSGEPILPEDTAWESFKERTMKAKDEEFVADGGDENQAKSAEN